MTLATPEIERELSQYERDLHWILENYDRLIQEHGDEYVAVLEGKVIDHDREIEPLVERLRSQYKEEFRRIVIEFIYKEHPQLVLGYAHTLQEG